VSAAEPTSMERVLSALGHREADRVPFLINASLHGAMSLGLSLKEYFSRSENVVEAQLRVREKYRHDFVMGFFYGAVDFEAWGAEVVFYDDGPPNSGEPFIKSFEQIDSLEPPVVSEAPRLRRVLKAIEMLKEKVRDEVPILGVVISPFSLPIMQMGFEKYIDLIYESPRHFDRLMAVNERFCFDWANAQISAGATAIVYFDPVSSPTVVPREMFLEKGDPVIRRAVAGIKGPVISHMASGRCIPIIDDLAGSGIAGIGVSALENIGEIKAACRGNLAVVGNLNAIEMRHWTAAEAESRVKDAIAAAGPGGGYVLSDNHGEIPLQVPEETLMAISEAVHKWGRYPLDWIENGG